MLLQAGCFNCFCIFSNNGGFCPGGILSWIRLCGIECLCLCMRMGLPVP